MGLKLIMFDFDGTLVDSQRVIVSAMADAFETLGLAAPEAAAVRRVVGPDVGSDHRPVAVELEFRAAAGAS